MSLTVVIGSHNRSHYLRKAIESVLDADEVIVYDDCSTDDSVQVAREYPVTVVEGEEKCGSPLAAINYGIEHAESEWLFFLGDDDWLLPESIPTMKRCLDGDIMYGDIYLAQPDETIRMLWAYDDRPSDSQGLIEFARDHKMNPIPMTGPFRLKWLRDKGLRYMRWETTVKAEDCRTFLEWAKHEPRFVRLPRPFVVYRQHEEQKSRVGREEFLEELEAYFKGA